MTLVESTSLISAIATIITLGVLIWYTYETRRIRLDANAQNQLIAKQLELTTSELKRQIHKDMIDSQPRITWDYGPAGAQSVTHKLKNYGGVMSNIIVACDPGFQATILPKDTIAQGIEAEVKFTCYTQPQPNPFKFFIEFCDKFNERKKMFFTASRKPDGSWQLPEPA
jgi:hypothetical protein